jgi:hypothetical protein
VGRYGYRNSYRNGHCYGHGYSESCCYGYRDGHGHGHGDVNSYCNRHFDSKHQHRRCDRRAKAVPYGNFPDGMQAGGC